MEFIELEMLHHLELKIAQEIKRICDKNSIKYGLSGGSLIGAVRHKGFIPWDDDMDIDMTRENYEKFQKICASELGAEFKLINWHTEKDYWNGFSKITLIDTEVIEETSEKAPFKLGVYVDIFPWDRVPNNKIVQVLHEKTIRFLLLVLLAKHNIQIPKKSSRFKKGLYKILRTLTKYIKQDKIVEAYEKILCFYDDSETKCVTCAVGVQGYQKNKVPAEWFKDYTELPFEDTRFSAIKKYDKLLRKSYGNYMRMPPEEERRTHNFLKLDLGKYNKEVNEYDKTRI